MELIGFACALIIGLSLGLIGGGGSILTVPVLVYLFGFNPVLATAYSLFVVGITSLVGAFAKYRKGYVDLKTALVFAVPSFIAVYLTRLLVIPAIPAVIYESRNLILSKDLLIMAFFGIIMFGAAISMIRSSRNEVSTEERSINYFKIIGDGIVVGALTGLVGAGGGFLIIPALVILAKLPMKLAVGTSLVIIALKSLIGFIGDLQSGQVINWSFLLSFTALAVVGIFAGNLISRYVGEGNLKKIFGWFVLVMSIGILTKELIIG